MTKLRMADDESSNGSSDGTIKDTNLDNLDADSDKNQEGSGIKSPYKLVVNVQTIKNGPRKVSTSKESWFDTLLRQVDESSNKTIDKSRINQCFNHFKSSPSVSNQQIVDGLMFEDFVRFMNELFVDHSADGDDDVSNSDHKISGNNGHDAADVDTSQESGSNDVPSVGQGLKSFYIPKSYYIELFQKFDRNRDNVIDVKEFNAMWGKWVQIILKPKAAFIIVDVQNDFINGSLAISKCPAGENIFLIQF